MWPMGHLGVAYCLYTLGVRLRADSPPARGPSLALVVGSQLPDLVDKPLAWGFDLLPTGRTLAHSLLVLVPLCLAVTAYAYSRDQTESAVGFSVGILSHPFIDALPVLWRPERSPDFLLWPSLPVEPPEGSLSVVGLFLDSLSKPYFWSQLVVFGIAVVLWTRHRRARLSDGS